MSVCGKTNKALSSQERQCLTSYSSDQPAGIYCWGSWTVLLHQLTYSPKACFCCLCTGIQCHLRCLQVSHLASSCSFGKAGVYRVSHAMLVPSGWFGCQIHGVIILLVWFYCTVVYIFLKSPSAFFCGFFEHSHLWQGNPALLQSLGLNVHTAQTHTAVVSGSLLEWLSWQKKCPGLKELVGITTYDVAPRASFSQIFGVTLTKNQRKGRDPSHSRKFKAWTHSQKRNNGIKFVTQKKPKPVYTSELSILKSLASTSCHRSINFCKIVPHYGKTWHWKVQCI